MLADKFGREEMQQRNDGQREGQPIKPGIQWNAENRPDERKNGTQDDFIEYIGKEQQTQEADHEPEKEQLAPQWHAPISDQLPNQRDGLASVQEYVDASRKTALLALLQPRAFKSLRI
jgi:hypothetical protein